jgi:uncharacterized protein
MRSRAALALVLGLPLAAACGMGGGLPPAAPSQEVAGDADAGAFKLPFRLPCADDDLAGCTKGCADKQTEDCVTLGSLYLAGVAVAPDQDRALGLFRAACTDGSARGCMRLADAFHAGLLTGEGEEIALYKQACDAGANLGCVAAAKAYLEGRGVGADPVYAATLFGRVCARGNAQACFELGRLYQAGEGVPASPEKSAEMFEKACKLGLDQGCLAASGTGEVLSPRE